MIKLILCALLIIVITATLVYRSRLTASGKIALPSYRESQLTEGVISSKEEKSDALGAKILWITYHYRDAGGKPHEAGEAIKDREVWDGLYVGQEVEVAYNLHDSVLLLKNKMR